MMLKLQQDFHDRLLDILLDIPALQEQDNRNLLLRHLPRIPVSGINRSSAPLVDLHNIQQAVTSWGQLDSGEWALVILAKNALRFAQGTEQGRALQALLAELETQPITGALSVIKEIVIGRDERLPLAFLKQGLGASLAVAKLVVPCIIGGVTQPLLGYGSCWLISADLLMTNYHVIEVRDRPIEPPASQDDFKAQALAAIAWFDYDDWDTGHSEYRCIELVDANDMLDYALLRLLPEALTGNQPLSAHGCLKICQTTPNLHVTVQVGQI